MMADGIHPTEEAQPLIAEEIFFSSLFSSFFVIKLFNGKDLFSFPINNLFGTWKTLTSSFIIPINFHLHGVG